MSLGTAMAMLPFARPSLQTPTSVTDHCPTLGKSPLGSLGSSGFVPRSSHPVSWRMYCCASASEPAVAAPAVAAEEAAAEEAAAPGGAAWPSPLQAGRAARQVRAAVVARIRWMRMGRFRRKARSRGWHVHARSGR